MKTTKSSIMIPISWSEIFCQWKFYNSQGKLNRKRGGVRVCGTAVLGYFWCGVTVIFISKNGIAVFRVHAVCREFKFYVAVVGEKIVLSR